MCLMGSEPKTKMNMPIGKIQKLKVIGYVCESFIYMPLS